MSNTAVKKKTTRRRWTLHHYHRYLGLMSAVFAVVLSITGIMLNHTEWWQLDQRKVSQQWLLDFYGIPEPQLRTAYKLDQRWLMQWDQSVYLDDKPLSGLVGSLDAAVATDDFIVAAAESKVALFSLDGELVDLLELPSSVSRVSSLGNVGEHVLAETDGGTFQLNDDLTEFLPTPDITEEVVWRQPSQMSGAIKERFVSGFQGNGLPLERVILDLHSGRLFGNVGVYLMDLMAVFLLVLAFTGVYSWAKRKLRRKAA